MHNERVWNIEHDLIHHSLAAGPAARCAYKGYEDYKRSSVKKCDC